jgi:cysteine synthase A
MEPTSTSTRPRAATNSSARAAYAVARWTAERDDAGTIAVIFPDRGDRYIGTIYSETYRIQRGVDDPALPDGPVPLASGAIATGWSVADLSQARLARQP